MYTRNKHMWKINSNCSNENENEMATEIYGYKNKQLSNRITSVQNGRK